MPNLTPSRLAAILVERLNLWSARARERRQLEDLDDRILRDIGLTRAEARSEAVRPPWSGDDRRAPQPRRLRGSTGLRAFRAR